MKNRERGYLIFLILLGLGILLLTASCDHLPFLRRLEIDHFPSANQELETMEVSGITYVRVVNPAHRDDPEVPQSRWIPITVFQTGNYQAYTANLPQPSSSTAANAGPGNITGAPAASTVTGYKQAKAKEKTFTPEKDKTPPRLRRRVLFFPSQAGIAAADIASLLTVEIEAKLPLKVVAPPADSKLSRQGRLLSSRQELTAAVRRWLGQINGAPPVQFVLFLTRRIGRDRIYYICTLIDAQSGRRAAAFTFLRELRTGRLHFPLVPEEPLPLIRLLEATLWWCRALRDPASKQQLRLTTGRSSGLVYGCTFRLFQLARAVHDPRNGDKLGFAFSDKLGEISVIDFFGTDGAIARSRKPLPDKFTTGYAVVIPTAVIPAAAGLTSPPKPSNAPTLPGNRKSLPES